MREEKEKNGELLSHRIHVRLTKKKYDELGEMLLRARGIRSLGELARHIIEGRKITVVTYDATLDRAMERLSGIRKELQAIGININQVARRFHSEELPEGRLFQALELVKLHQQADLKVSAVLELISKISERWLPK